MKLICVLTVGSIDWNGNYDNDATDGTNVVVFDHELTLSAEQSMTMKAIMRQGALSLLAGSGINLLDNLESAILSHVVNSTLSLVMDADSDNSGDGTFSVAATKEIESSNADITITAFDIDLDGSLDAGTGKVSVHASGGASVALGDADVGLRRTISAADADMTLSNGELGRITSAHFTLGGPSSGSMIIDGVTDTSSANVATITLVAATASSTVTFQTADSTFNKGIIVQANAGIAISANVNTQATASSFDSGSGTFTIQFSKSLHTGSQALDIKANDFDVTNGSINAATVLVDPVADIGFGTAVGTMTITDAEMGNILTTTGAVTLGSSTGGDINVAGITDGSTANVGTIKLIATDSASRIVFEAASSTFNKGIEVQAGAAVVFSESVTTAGATIVSAGAFTVDSAVVLTTDQTFSLATDTIALVGASELDSGTAGASIVVFTEDRPIDVGASNTANTLHVSGTELGKIKSAGGLSIGSTMNGNITADHINGTAAIGTLSLIASDASTAISFQGHYSTFEQGLIAMAGAGITLSQNVTSEGGAVTMSTGTGTLTLEASIELMTTNQTLVITADDIDLQTSSSLTSGIAVTTLNPTTYQSIALGNMNANLTLSSVEFSSFSSYGIVVGSNTQVPATTCSTLPCDASTVLLATGETIYSPASTQGVSGLHVVDLSKEQTSHVEGIVTLVATEDDATIVFSGAASTFWGLHAQADNGIHVQVDLTTLIGPMHLDGDYENSSTADSFNQISFNSDRSLVVEQGLTMHAESIHSAGPLTLKAGDGIFLMNSLTIDSGTGDLVIITDQHHVGQGTLTLSASKHITNAQGAIELSAWDIDLQGSEYFPSGIFSSTSIHVFASKMCSKTDFQDSASCKDQTIGIGVASSRNMHVSDQELLRMTVPDPGPVKFTRLVTTPRGGSILVDRVSRIYTTEADTIVFGGSTYHAVSSAYALDGLPQVVTKDYATEADFVAREPDGTPTVVVRGNLPLGSPITVQWNADTTGSRLSHEHDWIGLYK